MEGKAYKPHRLFYEKVPVQYENGDKDFVLGTDVDAAKAAGGRVIDPHLISGYKDPNQKLKEEQGDFGAAFATGSVSFAKRLSQGISGIDVVTPLLEKANLKGTYEALVEENPVGSAIGSSLGFGTGVIIGSKYGIGKVAGSLSGAAVSGLGSVGAKLGLTGVGAAGTQLTQALAGGQGLTQALGQVGVGTILREGSKAVGLHAAEGAVRGAVEGALYNTVEKVSEDVFHGQDLSVIGSKLAGYFKTGALWGAGAGAVFGTLGGIVHEAAPIAKQAKEQLKGDFKEVLQGGANYAEGKANESAVRSFGASASDRRHLGRDIEHINERVQSIGQTARESGLSSISDPTARSEAAHELRKKAGAEIGAFHEGLDAAASAEHPQLVQEHAALEGEYNKYLDELNAPKQPMEQELQKLNKMIDSGSPLAAGAKARKAEIQQSLKSYEESLFASKDISGKVTEYQDKLGALSKKIEASKVYSFPTQDFNQDVTNIIAQKRATPGEANEQAAKALENWMGDFNRFADKKAPGAQDVFRYHVELNKELRAFSTTGAQITPELLAKRELLTVLNGHMYDSMERGAEAMGGGVLEKYLPLAKTYGNLAELDKWGLQAASKAPPPMLGLKSLVAGAALMNHPVAAIGAIVGHNALQEVLPGMAAKAFNRLSKIEMLQKEVTRHDDMVTKGLEYLVHGGAQTAEHAAEMTASHAAEHVAKHAGLHEALSMAAHAEKDHETLHQEIEQIHTLAKNPEVFATRVAAMIGSHQDVAPNIVAAVSANAQTGANYLSVGAPKPLNAPDPLQPSMSKPRYTESDVDSFRQKQAVVADPVPALVSAMRSGTLNKNQVDTLKAVYPKLYEDLQTRTTEQILKADKEGRPISYARRLHLATLLGIPADGSMTPASIQALQASKQGGQEAPKPPPPSGGQHGSTKMKRDQFATQGDRIEGGNRG